MRSARKLLCQLLVRSTTQRRGRPLLHPQRLAMVMDDLGEGRDVAERGVVPGAIRSRGRFVADTCEPCGTVEWYGTRLDDLEPDEKRGVFRLLRPAAATNDRGGPYR